MDIRLIQEMKTPKLLILEAVTAFCIPFCTTCGSGLAPYLVMTSTHPQGWLLRLAIVVSILLAGVAAGMSGLKSFLSTSYSDFKDSTALDSSVTKTVEKTPATNL